MRSGMIQATGVLDELTVAHYDRSGRAMALPRQFRGPMQILLAVGLVAEEGGRAHLNLSLMASRQRDNGIELLGGACTGAKVIASEFTIEAMDDVLLRRELDRGTGLHLLSGAIPLTPPALAAAEVGAAPAVDAALARAPGPEVMSTIPEPTGPKQTLDTKPSWAEAVMASVRAPAPVEPEVEEHDEPYRPVRAGDLLDHQQFGRCVVQRVDSDEENVTVRLRNGRLVRLNLEVLRLRYQGEEEGHQVFSTGSGGE